MGQCQCVVESRMVKAVAECLGSLIHSLLPEIVNFCCYFNAMMLLCIADIPHPTHPLLCCRQRPFYPGVTLYSSLPHDLSKDHPFGCAAIGSLQAQHTTLPALEGWALLLTL